MSQLCDNPEMEYLMMWQKDLGNQGLSGKKTTITTRKCVKSYQVGLMLVDVIISQFEEMNDNFFSNFHSTGKASRRIAVHEITKYPVTWGYRTSVFTFPV